MTALWFTLATLATYRVAYMIAIEDGPADVFVWLRTQVYLQWTGKKQKERGGNWYHWTYRGINCPLCISFWLSWAAAAGIPWTSWREYLYLSLGIAGGIVVLHRLTSGIGKA